MIAEHFAELVELQEKHGTALLYEASSCGGIPIIRTLEEYYDNESLKSVSGIFNGSSNYILTKIFDENQDYASALKKAQDLGFAETDPKLDVGGYDAKYKLIILAAHSYGLITSPDEVLNLGIENLSDAEINLARNNGLKIKLIASATNVGSEKIALNVLPRFIEETSPFATVNNEYNAVLVEAAFSDKQLFIGKGAGSHPTGSAVLSDISANSYDYQYEYKKRKQTTKFKLSNDTELTIYTRIEDSSKALELPFSKTFYEGEGVVVGTIKSADLIAGKSWLEENNVFVADVHETLPAVLKGLEETVKQASL